MATDPYQNPYLKAYDPNQPTQPSKLDYEQILKSVGTAAQKTRDVQIPSMKGVSDYRDDAFGAFAFYNEDLHGALRRDAQVDALMAEHATKVEQTKRRAAKAADALEIKGASTVQSLQAMEAVQGRVIAGQEKAEVMYGEAAKKGGEYVEATRARTKGVLRDIDRIFEDIGERRDFAKAHAMQVSVQAVLGSMETEGRAIAEKYGVASKEFETFRGKKGQTLGNIQSQIHVGYQQMAEETHLNYLNARTDAEVRMHMYTGFQEQQHVETIEGMAKSSSMYNMQVGQFMVGVEQMKMAGLDDLANWMVQTPEFSVELAPLMEAVASIYGEGGGGRGGGVYAGGGGTNVNASMGYGGAGGYWF